MSLWFFKFILDIITELQWPNERINFELYQQWISERMRNMFSTDFKIRDTSVSGTEMNSLWSETDAEKFK